MTTTIVLAAPGLDSLVLARGDGYIVKSFDWKPGSLRSVSFDAPDGNGSINSTRLRGAGGVTIGMRLIPTVEPVAMMAARLGSFCHADLRPALIIDGADGMPVRFATLCEGKPLGSITNPIYRDVVVQWECPTGILESFELQSATVSASGTPGSLGRPYDLTFPRDYPLIDPEGTVEVVNAGNADAYPLIRLYGPWSDETFITNELTGQSLVFDGESVTAGNFLEIDTRPTAKTIRLNGNAVDSRYHRLVFPDSQWWTLRPGTQRIRFAPETFSVPAQAEIVWRDAWTT